MEPGRPLAQQRRRHQRREHRRQIAEEGGQRRPRLRDAQPPAAVGDQRRPDRHVDQRRRHRPAPTHRGHADGLLRAGRGPAEGQPEQHLRHQQRGPVPVGPALAPHVGGRPRQQPAVEGPGQHGQQHQQVAPHELHLRQAFQVPARDHQRHAAERQQRPGELAARRPDAIEQRAHRQHPHRQAGGDQRHVERGGAVQRLVLQRVVAAHAQQPGQREVAPAGPQRGQVLQQRARRAGDQQQQREGQRPAHRVEQQRRHQRADRAPDHGVAGPQQRGQGQHQGQAWGQAHRGDARRSGGWHDSRNRRVGRRASDIPP